MRIVTWNLWHQIGAWPDRRAGILSELAELRPDVVGLQEVWVGPDGSMAHEIAEQLGWRSVVLSNPGPARPGTLLNSNAIVSRFPVESTATLRLPGPDRRWVTHASLRTPRGPLAFFVTHLSWRPEHGPRRLAQVRAITAFIRSELGIPGPGSWARDGYPVVLCGDFNAVPASDEIRLLTGTASALDPDLVLLDAWEVAGSGAGHTWDPATNRHTAGEPLPARRVDYVFVGLGETRGHVRTAHLAGTGLRDGLHPSDHFAVAVTLSD